METASEVVSNTVADIFVCELPEETMADKQPVSEEVSIAVNNPSEENTDTAVVTVKVKKENEQVKTNFETQSDSEESVEEIEEDDDEVDDDNVDKVEGDNMRIVTEDVTQASDFARTKTVSIEKIEPDSKAIEVTTSIVKNQNNATVPISEKTAHTTEIKEKQAANVDDEEMDSEEDETEEDYKGPEPVKCADKVKVLNELQYTDKYSQQHLIKEQNQKDTETQPEPQPETQVEPQAPITIKEETVVDAANPDPITNRRDTNITNKQGIISSIDSNIKVEENIAALKERELELIKKQQELAKEIKQQKLLAEKLASENHLKQKYNNRLMRQENDILPNNYQPITNMSKHLNYGKNDNVYSHKSEIFEARESTNVSKKIDLNKIFTPAIDAEEILPKSRKLYASSAFYSPILHPTVEDQVELARRISNSLSDISNQQSRGQSMYVNRKKRSVKWVHEGCGQDETENIKSFTEEDYDLEENESDVSHHEKVPLKFLMNPSGQIRDINSLRESINTETGLLSPDVSAEVVTALQARKGKGAELFAKRRKVAEKWVVDESNVGVQSPSGLPDYHQYQQQPRPPISPSILPAYTDAAKRRVQLNLHQEQVLEKYAKPGLKVVQTPWEAALTSGSASAAFIEDQNYSPYLVPTLVPSPTPQLFDASQGEATIPNSSDKPYSTFDCKQHLASKTTQERHYTGTNSIRELAYKPSIPQGWKAPSMSLPKDLYMPKEIPLQSYAPPPVATVPKAASPFSLPPASETNQYSSYKALCGSPVAEYTRPELVTSVTKSYGGSSRFPASNPNQQCFLATYGNNKPPKQLNLPPQSYQKIQQDTSKNIPQANFNPSPLPYDKLAKFENQADEDGRYTTSHPMRSSNLKPGVSKVRNLSPTPFAGSYSQYYGGTSDSSPRPFSFNRDRCAHNTSTVSTNQILSAPSYNNSARGWGYSGTYFTGYQYPESHISAPKSQISNVGSMPYTDF